MIRLSYPNAKRRALALSLIPTGIVVSGVWGMGIYFWFKFDYEWAAALGGIVAVILGGGLQYFLMYHRFTALPCPNCGKVNLKLTEIDGSNQLLICSACKIEWDTEIPSNPSPS